MRMVSEGQKVIGNVIFYALGAIASFVAGFVFGAVAEARRRRIEMPYLRDETRRKLRRGELKF